MLLEYVHGQQTIHHCVSCRRHEIQSCQQNIPNQHSSKARGSIYQAGSHENDEWYKGHQYLGMTIDYCSKGEVHISCMTSSRK